jgi:hypothetical protein
VSVSKPCQSGGGASGQAIGPARKQGGAPQEGCDVEADQLGQGHRGCDQLVLRPHVLERATAVVVEVMNLGLIDVAVGDPVMKRRARMPSTQRSSSKLSSFIAYRLVVRP